MKRPDQGEKMPVRRSFRCLFSPGPPPTLLHLWRFYALKLVRALCRDASRGLRLLLGSRGCPPGRPRSQMASLCICACCSPAELQSAEGTVCLSSCARSHDSAHTGWVVCWPTLLDLEHRCKKTGRPIPGVVHHPSHKAMNTGYVNINGNSSPSSHSVELLIWLYRRSCYYKNCAFIYVRMIECRQLGGLFLHFC